MGRRVFVVYAATFFLLVLNSLAGQKLDSFKTHENSWGWLKNSEETVSVFSLNSRGPAVFIGYAGYDVSTEMCQKWVYGVVTQSPFKDLFSKIYAVPGPKDPPYEKKYIKNDVLAKDGNVNGAQIVYIAAHSSGTYVADEFLGYASPALLQKIRLVILDGGEITPDHKNEIRHRFVSAIKRLPAPREVEGGTQSYTLESWNYRLYRDFYGKNFISLNADDTACQTEHDIHDYVINPQAGEKDIIIYAGPRFNLEAAFPWEFAAELQTYFKKTTQNRLWSPQTSPTQKNYGEAGQNSGCRPQIQILFSMASSRRGSALFLKITPSKCKWLASQPKDGISFSSPGEKGSCAFCSGLRCMAMSPPGQPRCWIL